jgi:mono/diheme cytochrome c family protein
MTAVREFRRVCVGFPTIVTRDVHGPGQFERLALVVRGLRIATLVFSMSAFAGFTRSVVAVSLLFGFNPGGSRQTTFRTPPPLVIRSMAGGDLFRFYCASCHGSDGRGHGPVVAALRTLPPDLTTISVRSGGSFPRAEIGLYVTGDEVRPARAHGSKEMPVWGPIFQALDPDDRTRKIRIQNIVDYLESIQSK